MLPEKCTVDRDPHHLAAVVHVHRLRALYGAERAEVCEGVRRRATPQLVGSERGDQDQRKRSESSLCFVWPFGRRKAASLADRGTSQLINGCHRSHVVA